MNNIEFIRQKLPEYLSDITNSGNQKDFYVCPLCNSGEKKNKTAAMHYSIGRDGVPRVICYSCHGIKNINGTKEGADIFDLICLVEGFGTFKEAYQYAAKRFGLEDNVKADPGIEYLTQKRKLSAQIIDRYKLRYVHKLTGKKADGSEKVLYRLIEIPYPDSDFKIYKFINSERMTGSGYYKSENIKEPVFNGHLVGKEKVLFITEAQFCALSIEQANGTKAIATGGTGFDKLLEQIDRDGVGESSFIITYDNDKAGSREGERLLDELRKRNIPAICAKISGKYKDPNEALVGEPAAFKDDILKAIELLKNTYAKKAEGTVGIESLELYDSYRLSGFSNIDSENLINGNLINLYGNSGSGKTVFLSQLCEQIARQNDAKVLYCSFSERSSMILRLFLKRAMSRIMASGKIELPNTLENKRKIEAHLLKNIQEELIGKVDFYDRRNEEKTQRAVQSFLTDNQNGVVILDSIPVSYIHDDFMESIRQSQTSSLVIVSSYEAVDFPFEQVWHVSIDSQKKSEQDRIIFELNVMIDRSPFAPAGMTLNYDFSPDMGLIRPRKDENG